MREAGLAVVRKEDAEIVAALGFERAGMHVGRVIKFLRRFDHRLASAFADVGIAVQRLADRCHGYPYMLGQITDRDGHLTPPCDNRKRFRYIK